MNLILLLHCTNMYACCTVCQEYSAGVLHGAEHAPSTSGEDLRQLDMLCAERLCGVSDLEILCEVDHWADDKSREE
jgi:hypothetical protein